MTYQRRPAAPTNTIKLTFDYDTLDRLKALAAQRKVDTYRCAYELIQEALGVRQPPAAPLSAPEPKDEQTLAVRRGIDAMRGYRPVDR